MKRPLHIPGHACGCTLLFLAAAIPRKFSWESVALKIMFGAFMSCSAFILPDRSHLRKWTCSPQSASVPRHAEEICCALPEGVWGVVERRFFGDNFSVGFFGEIFWLFLWNIPSLVATSETSEHPTSASGVGSKNCIAHQKRRASHQYVPQPKTLTTIIIITIDVWPRPMFMIMTSSDNEDKVDNEEDDTTNNIPTEHLGMQSPEDGPNFTWLQARAFWAFTSMSRRDDYYHLFSLTSPRSSTLFWHLGEHQAYLYINFGNKILMIFRMTSGEHLRHPRHRHLHVNSVLLLFHRHFQALQRHRRCRLNLDYLQAPRP